MKIPTRFDRHKHTRRAYRFGHAKGSETGRMFTPAEVREHAESPVTEPGFIDAVESEDWEHVGHWYAPDSRDTGGTYGLRALETLEEMAENGVSLSRFAENGDSCMIDVHGGVSSGVATGERHLLDETIEAYDSGYAAGFAETIDN